MFGRLSGDGNSAPGGSSEVKWEEVRPALMRVGDVTPQGRVERVEHWPGANGGHLGVDVHVGGRVYSRRANQSLERRVVGDVATEREELRRAAAEVSKTDEGWPQPGREYPPDSPQARLRVALAAYAATDEGREELTNRLAKGEAGDMVRRAEISTALGDVDRTRSDVGVLATAGGPIRARQVGREGEFLVYQDEDSGQQFRIHHVGAPPFIEGASAGSSSSERNVTRVSTQRTAGGGHVCGAPTTTGRDRGRACQNRVSQEGDRCPRHPR